MSMNSGLENLPRVRSAIACRTGGLPAHEPSLLPPTLGVRRESRACARRTQYESFVTRAWREPRRCLGADEADLQSHTSAGLAPGLGHRPAVRGGSRWPRGVGVGGADRRMVSDTAYVVGEHIGSIIAPASKWRR